MFSLQPRDELVFGAPAVSEPDEILNDVIADRAVEGSNYINFCSKSNKKKLGQTTKLGFQKRQIDRRDECNIKKVTRREMEREKRQEMSNLYGSLRSLLPLEHIKGKRSICDQMQEAVNYIEYMQKNIQELRILRDKLQTSSGTKVESSNHRGNSPNCVTVNMVPNGVEILITSSIEGSELGLSRMLAELLERELHVISCVSTKTNGRFLHKIQAESRDMARLDVSALQERLTNSIN